MEYSTTKKSSPEEVVKILGDLKKTITEATPPKTPILSATERNQAFKRLGSRLRQADGISEWAKILDAVTDLKPTESERKAFDNEYLGRVAYTGPSFFDNNTTRTITTMMSTKPK